MNEQRHRVNEFREYDDRYVLIGVTACDLAMDEAGLDFRVTNDLDGQLVKMIQEADKWIIR